MCPRYGCGLETILHVCPDCYLCDLESLPSGSRNIAATESLLWRPPVDPWVCVNFYDGLFDNYKVANMGVAVKNSEGLLMGLAYFEQEHVPCLLTTEALACMRALGFARDLGFRCVELEGNSVVLISKLNSYDIDRSKVSTLVKDAKRLESGVLARFESILAVLDVASTVSIDQWQVLTALELF
ncbi:hypothetical protein Goshw_014851 [Gossypium schwendimanii]|uniref:RNase H type-1 domain-containing protein n=1 Tax=Gossypium schwendimanii TaxID=34291 RepID=A0A7J9LPF5_GOSSC|nr:hypothetical protein [Gossypium schwendimanii]